MKLIFASNNQNKLREIKALIPPSIEILSLEDIQYNQEIEETGHTLEDNAAIKARTIFDVTGEACFADDSGLLVDFLDGQPGVKSARYAGEPSDNSANMDLLLLNLGKTENRNAKFQTVICYKDATQELYFKGEIKGNITHSKNGTQGFGYDPIFTPLGYSQTFAEMTAEEKNKISHRKNAITQLILFLNGLK
ncbi:MAG: RdgB/HAM1 family non-canonical purine NTP pyrophosphatase [bacterium]|nr:RdgB/HAM1 family non-canonical purine NTP pyrophosphatase [bacterium]